MLLMCIFYLIFKHSYTFRVRTLFVKYKQKWFLKIISGFKTRVWHSKALAAALKAARWEVHHVNYFIIDELLRRKRLTLDLYSRCFRRLSLNISDWVYQQCVTGEHEWKLYIPLLRAVRHCLKKDDTRAPSVFWDIGGRRNFCNLRMPFQIDPSLFSYSIS